MYRYAHDLTEELEIKADFNEISTKCTTICKTIQTLIWCIITRSRIHVPRMEGKWKTLRVMKDYNIERGRIWQTIQTIDNIKSDVKNLKHCKRMRFEIWQGLWYSTSLQPQSFFWIFLSRIKIKSLKVVRR